MRSVIIAAVVAACGAFACGGGIDPAPDAGRVDAAAEQDAGVLTDAPALDGSDDACRPGTCAGCCDEAGACVKVDNQTVACGLNGMACQGCGYSPCEGSCFFCTGGMCVPTSGSSNSSSGGSGSGSGDL